MRASARQGPLPPDFRPFIHQFLNPEFLAALTDTAPMLQGYNSTVSSFDFDSCDFWLVFRVPVTLDSTDFPVLCAAATLNTATIELIVIPKKPAELI
jgi:hypothetical protein